MMCYDRKPDPQRPPIHIAGDLILRGDKLSLEAGNVIGELVDQIGQIFERCGHVKQRRRGEGLLCPDCKETP